MCVIINDLFGTIFQIDLLFVYFKYNGHLIALMELVGVVLNYTRSLLKKKKSQRESSSVVKKKTVICLPIKKIDSRINRLEGC